MHQQVQNLVYRQQVAVVAVDTYSTHGRSQIVYMSNRRRILTSNDQTDTIPLLGALVNPTLVLYDKLGTGRKSYRGTEV